MLSCWRRCLSGTGSCWHARRRGRPRRVRAMDSGVASRSERLGSFPRAFAVRLDGSARPSRLGGGGSRRPIRLAGAALPVILGRGSGGGAQTQSDRSGQGRAEVLRADERQGVQQGRRRRRRGEEEGLGGYETDAAAQRAEAGESRGGGRLPENRG